MATSASVPEKGEDLPSHLAKAASPPATRLVFGNSPPERVPSAAPAKPAGGLEFATAEPPTAARGLFRDPGASSGARPREHESLVVSPAAPHRGAAPAIGCGPTAQEVPSAPLELPAGWRQLAIAQPSAADRALAWGAAVSLGAHSQEHESLLVSPAAPHQGAVPATVAAQVPSAPASPHRVELPQPQPAAAAQPPPAAAQQPPPAMLLPPKKRPWRDDRHKG
eukprot:TRINITY_DN21049_c0_g2_i1.p1 TRINITY_DN21049_c0_g2~~TRINITY_DN21049_c0_g2_i1.p1  ORF type:complete len:223 (+),score=21.87 TRINITY_DN21049_c0_g2_i1:138-806(+)